ncbi:hypothetical protein D3C72_1614780 [compost metagenome]
MDELRVLGHFGEDPQLDLRVVGDYQLAVGIRHEAGPVALLVGDLLDVGVGRRHAARVGSELVKLRVNPAGDGVNVAEKGLAVSA